MDYIYELIYTILFVSLSAAGLAYMAYRIFFCSHKKTQDYIENNEFKDKKLRQVKVICYFFMDWCDYCQNSKPILEANSKRL